MAIRKKGTTHHQPMTTKKPLKKKTVIKAKKTINKKVDNKRSAIIKKINVLLKELA